MSDMTPPPASDPDRQSGTIRGAIPPKMDIACARVTVRVDPVSLGEAK